MPGQHGVEMGGTMRLGLWPCQLKPGTRAAAAYGTDLVQERHRHRFEVNNAYRDQLEAVGLVVSGASPDNHLAEIMEFQGPPVLCWRAVPPGASKPARTDRTRSSSISSRHRWSLSLKEPNAHFPSKEK